MRPGARRAISTGRSATPAACSTRSSPARCRAFVSEPPRTWSEPSPKRLAWNAPTGRRGSGRSWSSPAAACSPARAGWRTRLPPACGRPRSANRAGYEVDMHYAMSNVVAAESQLGRPETALARARSSIARLEDLGGGAGAGHLWLGVMNAEALLGRVDAAVDAGPNRLCAPAARRRRTARVLGSCAVRRAAGQAVRCGAHRRLCRCRAGTRRRGDRKALDDDDRSTGPDAPRGTRSGRPGAPAAEGAAMREEDAVRLALGNP